MQTYYYKRIIACFLLISAYLCIPLSCDLPEPPLKPQLVVRIIIDNSLFKESPSRSPIDESILSKVTIQFFQGEELHSEFDFPYSKHEAVITTVPEGTYTIKGIAEDKDGNAVLEGMEDNIVLINGETTMVELTLEEIGVLRSKYRLINGEIVDFGGMAVSSENPMKSSGKIFKNTVIESKKYRIQLK